VSRKKKAPSIGKPTGEFWVYWISRDNLAGELAAVYRLWYRKPTREVTGNTILWQATAVGDPGHLGVFNARDLAEFGCRTLPDTDLELIRQEMGVTEEMERRRPDQ
jgi:hypothetical protein